jgi:hypothetical protein
MFTLFGSVAVVIGVAEDFPQLGIRLENIFFGCAVFWFEVKGIVREHSVDV